MPYPVLAELAGGELRGRPKVAATARADVLEAEHGFRERRVNRDYVRRRRTEIGQVTDHGPASVSGDTDDLRRRLGTVPLPRRIAPSADS